MTEKLLTPEEKVSQGLPLVAQDVEYLSQDKNSEFYKQKMEMQKQVEAEHAFIIHIFIQFALAIQHAVLKEEANQFVIRIRSEAEQQRNQAAAQAQLAAASRPAMTPEKVNDILKADLNKLLSTPINTMTATESARHHQQLISNFNNQVAALLGPEITLDSGRVLAVAQLVSRPQASAAQVLQHNLELAEIVKNDPAIRQAFAEFHAKACVGHIGVIGQFNSLLKQIGLTPEDLSPSERKQLIKMLDSAHYDVQKFNGKLIDVLIANNKKGLDLQAKGFPPEPFEKTAADTIPPTMSGTSARTGLPAGEAKPVPRPMPEVKKGAEEIPLPPPPPPPKKSSR